MDVFSFVSRQASGKQNQPLSLKICMLFNLISKMKAHETTKTSGIIGVL